MVRNNPAEPLRQRKMIMDRGASLHIRADVVACVHQDVSDDHATLIAIRFRFSPVKYSRRARMANITLSFTAEGDAPKVLGIAPHGGFLFHHERSEERTVTEAASGIEIAGLAATTGLSGGVKWSQTIYTERKGSTRLLGEIVSPNPKTALRNGAHWSLQENEITRAGIPEALTVAILLGRNDDKTPVSMNTDIDVKLNGISFEEILAGNQGTDDPVVFDPKWTPNPWNGLFGLKDPSNSNLHEFWRNPDHQQAILQYIEKESSTRCRLLDNVPELEGRTAPEPPTMETPENSDDLERFNAAIKEAIYIELWNTTGVQPKTPGALQDRWKSLTRSPDKKGLPKSLWLKDEVLSQFSWLKNEEKLPEPVLECERQRLENNEMVDANSARAPYDKHTSCSMLVRKAESQKSFKVFRDLNHELFDEEMIGLIGEHFGMENYYNDFRRFDFGCCEIFEMGKGRETNILYIMQTPYYKSGFWSMFLVGKEDPEDPGRSRKLSGLIQSGADVKLRGILRNVVEKAEEASYHPLLLPYQLYVDHCRTTSEQFDDTLHKVEFVEESITKALHGEKPPIYQVQGKVDNDEDPETNHWGLAGLGKTLHEASMEITELVRRRKFEDDLSEALKKELDKERPAQNPMLRDLKRRHRWANAHQLDITGMPSRVDSLKTLLYSMIAQQDNVVSIKLAKEGLSDSKAMKTLSVITILFLPGTFVATMFTTNVISFENPTAETMAYIKAVVPLTVSLMILYGLWLWKEPEWSRTRRRGRDPEACLGRVRHPFKSSSAGDKKGKQS
ncbi:hypothetical protein EsH8_XIV_000039 [Colletotrichum jinshuiense]